MQFSSALLLAAASLVSAAPSSAPVDKRVTGITMTAKFDALTGGAAPTSPYMGITYTGAEVQADNALTEAFPAHSPPNSISTTGVNGLLDGNIINLQVAQGAQYAAFHQMYVGCAVDVASALVARDCTVICSALTVAGLRKSTTFKYTAGTTMELIKLPAYNFNKVTQLTLTAVDSGLNGEVLSLNVDDINYTLFG